MQVPRLSTYDHLHSLSSINICVDFNRSQEIDLMEVNIWSVHVYTGWIPRGQLQLLATRILSLEFVWTRNCCLKTNFNIQYNFHLCIIIPIIINNSIYKIQRAKYILSDRQTDRNNRDGNGLMDVTYLMQRKQMPSWGKVLWCCKEEQVEIWYGHVERKENEN